MSGVATVRDLVERQARRSPDAPALLSCDGEIITYGSLGARTAKVAAVLAAHGVEPGQAVALVLPNGVDMALAFLGVAAATVCVPLNPALTAPEIGFVLDDIHAVAMVVDDHDNGPARSVARDRSITVIERSALLADRASANHAASARTAADAALVLHTSGTTSRPKQVALTHANLLASAHNVAATLALAPDDRGL